MRKLWGKAGTEQPLATRSTTNLAEADQAAAVKLLVLIMLLLLLLLLQQMQLLLWLLFDVAEAGIVSAATTTFAVVVVVVVDVAGACNKNNSGNLHIQTFNLQHVVAVVVAKAAVAPGRSSPGRNQQTAQ